MKGGSTFLRALALGSVQCGAVIPSAPLPTLSPSLAPPTPPLRTNDKGVPEQSCVTLSAGKNHSYRVIQILRAHTDGCRLWSWLALWPVSGPSY